MSAPGNSQTKRKPDGNGSKKDGLAVRHAVDHGAGEASSS